MKRYLRYLALLLCLCVFSMSFSSCMTYFRIYDEFEQMVEEVLGEPKTDETEREDNNSGELPEDLPLEYTLTEADREAFERQLEICRTITLEGKDKQAIEEAWDTLEVLYYHIAPQSQIAYILYCWDQSSEAISDAYLYASEMSAEVYADYMDLCQEIDTSDSPYRDAFFADWTEEEIEEMRVYSEELSELYDENDRILVEYRELDEKEFENEAAELYYQTVLNNNRIAALKGYGNYYEYAYDKVYLRDYSTAEAAELHRLCANHLIPLYKKASSDFQSMYDRLNSFEKSFISSFLYSDYDDMTVNYVKAYVNQAPESMRKAMQTMFENGNSIFTDSENSYAGAFTGMLYEYEKPICYFGPGYQSSTTVIHELGHYYAEQYHIDDDLAMDLAEVHSQGNEMLFLVFLKDHISTDIYETLVSYLLLDTISTIVLCMVIDEFEMTVYQNAGQIAKPTEDFDRLMYTVLERYGGEDFFVENIADPYLYWRYVTIENPVYYISYAVSGIATIELYAAAEENYKAAQETYRKLAEEVAPSDGFLAALQLAGLGSPLDAKTYTKIQLAFERK